MDSIKPPESLKLTGSVDSSWRTFKQQFALYIQAVGLSDESDSRKIALLLTVAGPQAIEVYNTFTFAVAADREKYDEVIKKFDEHCSPKKNETYERYVFRTRIQSQGENFDSFLTDLKLKAKTCNFGVLAESMIRDQIVFGIDDKKVRERLLRETELTFEGAVKICHASEIALLHSRTFTDKGSTGADCPVVGAVTHKMKRQSQKAVPKTCTDSFCCKRCGSRHLPKQCPAYGKQCAKCKGMNHFAKQCFSKNKTKQSTFVHVVDDTELSDTFFVGMINGDTESVQDKHKENEKNDSDVNCVSEDKWIVSLQVNGTIVPLKLDTGAKANLISISDIKEMKIKPQIKRNAVSLKTYNGQDIKTQGVCRLRVSVKNKTHHLLFVVVPDNLQSLLGDKACEELGLVKRVYCINSHGVTATQQESTNDIVRKFDDVFKGLGALPFIYKIQLKDNAHPVVHAPRRISAPLKEKLKQELDKMTALGVIKKVEEPTDWVNSMVCVKKKNGDLRVCMDPRDLNASIKREHYQIPKREEITSEMTGAQYFSKLDASQGFWQLKLHEDSTKYCTFNTPFGRYSFLRLPFGIISASEIFHRAMEHIIEGLEGVRAYVDDLVVWGSTLQEHNQRLFQLLQRVQKYGLKLNRAKCLFGVTEMTFLGDKLSGCGVEPDKSKIQAILDMPSPVDKKGVLRIMGMVNFIGKFIPNLSAKTATLRELLNHKNEFNWTSKHEQEWKVLKSILTRAPVLTYFDSSKSIKISTDASKDGLGAVLLQAEGDCWKPIAYASRTMTQSECRYAQIEKECLGLVFGFEKFHDYVYGLSLFTAETDHKPLIAIIKKNLNQMSPRIQRLMMRLQRYDFELVYTPGKYIVLADALSRAPLTSKSSDMSSTEDDVSTHVNLVVESLPVSDRKLKQIAEETAKDPVLQAVIQNLNNVWVKSSCPQFYNVRAELSVADGILLRRDRIVVPQVLKKEMLSRIHEGHLGMEKCKRRSRDSVYWPGINSEIEKMVSTCEVCLKHQNKQAREPMITTDLPQHPWQKVGTDLFHFHGKEYLLVVDYFSSFPEIALLSNPSSACVIQQMKSIFARHGIPLVVVSDNGPCYNSREFQDFAAHYDFRHITSSPHHAQSNGKAEKGVHIVKQLLKKASEGKSDPYLALLSYRATPLEHGASPAELLMNRKIRTTLPCKHDTKRDTLNNAAIKQKRKDLQKRQKRNYDKQTKMLKVLSRNDTVRVENANCWDKKAVVLEEVNPRSYVVRTENGQVLRRNRRSLLKTQETSQTLTDTEGEVPSCQTSSSSSIPLDNGHSAETNASPILRRSSRIIKKPDRLNL